MSRHKAQITQQNPLAVHSSLEDGFKLAKILFYSASIPILFLDRNYSILMTNSSCSRFLGFEQSVLVGKQISILLEKGQIEDFHDLQQSLRRDEQYWRSEFKIRKFDGSTVRLEITVQRVELRDQIIYFLYLGRAQFNWNDLEKLERTNKMAETLNSSVQSLQKEQSRYQSDLAHHIEINLLPGLEKMSREPDDKIRSNYKHVLTRELIWLSNGSGMESDLDLLKLTPTEMDVCKYIQSGLSSKEIAEMMYSSFDTIQTHRKNIRKKMGLNGQKISLCTFLRMKKRVTRNQAQA